MNQTIKKSLVTVGAALTLLGFASMNNTTANADEVTWVARTVDQVKEALQLEENGSQTYVVQSGDTLSVIAQAMNVSLDTLVRVNNVENANLIYPGTEINYSAEEKQVSVKTEDESHTYQVEANNDVVEVEQPEEEAAPQVAATTSGYEVTVSATAYSYAEAGLSNYTADGTNLVSDPYVIAVDPSVIPLGSLVEIPGYGVFRAADTGGAIVGNRIDVHFSSVAEALNFGRRTLTIRVLG